MGTTDSVLSVLLSVLRRKKFVVVFVVVVTNNFRLKKREFFRGRGVGHSGLSYVFRALLNELRANVCCFYDKNSKELDNSHSFIVTRTQI